VRRLQARISQLEEQVRAGAGASPQVVQHAVVPLAAGAMYVTHKEMELVQENQALRQQLQQALMAPGGGSGGALIAPDGWVTTTRGGTAVDAGGAPDPGQEVWMPAASLGGGWGATPLLAAKAGGGILAAVGGGGDGDGLVTPLRGAPGGAGGAGSTRATPGSEGSVKTAHAPGSGGARARGSGAAAAAVGMLPPLRAGSLVGSPSKGSSSGTPRERAAAALNDSRTRLEQISLNLNVSWGVWRGSLSACGPVSCPMAARVVAVGLAWTPPPS
jgi:hypothetical protein